MGDFVSEVVVLQPNTKMSRCMYNTLGLQCHPTNFAGSEFQGIYIYIHLYIYICCIAGSVKYPVTL